jgi:HSP20 family protein
MLKVPVIQVHESGELSSRLSQQSEILDGISQRAFDLYQQRGAQPGHDLDDWLQAERELLWAPPAELIETETQFKFRLAVPGYDAKDLQVTVFPDAIVVRAEAFKEIRNNVTVHIRELSSRTLLRMVSLPSGINVEKVTATLDQGVLRLVALKSDAAGENLQAAASSAAG